MGSSTFTQLSKPNSFTILTPEDSLNDIAAYLLNNLLVSSISAASNVLFPKLAAYEIFFLKSGANFRKYGDSIFSFHP